MLIIFKNEIFVCNKCKKQISFEVRNWNNVNLIEEFQSENKSNTENLVKETELNYGFVKTPYYFSFKINILRLLRRNSREHAQRVPRLPPLKN